MTTTVQIDRPTMAALHACIGSRTKPGAPETAWQDLVHVHGHTIWTSNGHALVEHQAPELADEERAFSFEPWLPGFKDGELRLTAHQAYRNEAVTPIVPYAGPVWDKVRAALEGDGKPRRTEKLAAEGLDYRLVHSIMGPFSRCLPSNKAVLFRVTRSLSKTYDGRPTPLLIEPVGYPSLSIWIMGCRL